MSPTEWWWWSGFFCGALGVLLAVVVSSVVSDVRYQTPSETPDPKVGGNTHNKESSR